MSVLDRLNLFSNDQVITASAASTDVIDLITGASTCAVAGMFNSASEAYHGSGQRLRFLAQSGDHRR